MVRDGTIHLICKSDGCGGNMNYLARRYAGALLPRCPKCEDHMKPSHEDMITDGEPYRALDFSRDAVGTGIRLSRSPSDRIVVR